MNDIIQENRYSTNINYILKDESMFYEVGYKVLQNQDNNGFVKCVKVMHNGKIKLVYDISKYKDLETVIGNSSQDILMKIIRKLLTVALSIKENGFIEYKNINTNINSIFIDTNNLNIYFIYIPIVWDSGRTEKTFNDELKKNILKTIEYNSELRGTAINNLCLNLTSNKSLEDILEDIKSNTRDAQHGERRNTVINEQMDSKIIEKKIDTKNEVNAKEKNGYISSLSKIFSRKKKNEVNEVKDNTQIRNTSSFKTKYEHYNSCDDTTLLSEEQCLKIGLKGTNTPVEITVVINKPHFILGSKSECADGVISFNRAISRKHCSILEEGGRHYILDEGSSNGTFINGRRLEKNIKEEIVPGDRVTLANSEFIIMEII